VNTSAGHREAVVLRARSLQERFRPTTGGHCGEAGTTASALSQREQSAGRLPRPTAACAPIFDAQFEYGALSRGLLWAFIVNT
jgi:hypothetical protein